MKELTEREAFNKAAVYCSRSEHCVSEVCEKLRQWGVSDVDMQQRIVHQLKEELYIDERRFCHAFVHDKFHFNHWGRQKIAMYLCQKRLPSAFIEEALQEIADDESLQAAKDLLATKLPSVKANNAYELYAKLMRFASGRGIEMDIARRAIRQLVEEVPEE
jgi:regulatory protein